MSRTLVSIITAFTVAGFGWALAPQASAQTQETQAVPRVKPASACFALGQKYGTGCYGETHKKGSACFQGSHMWFAKTAYAGRKAKTVVCIIKYGVSGKWYDVPSHW